jgi:hypothetical protein
MQGMGISGLDSFQIADRLFVLTEEWIESRMKINSFSLQTTFTNYVTSGSWHPLPPTPQPPHTHTIRFSPSNPHDIPSFCVITPTTHFLSFPLLISFRKITWVFRLAPRKNNFLRNFYTHIFLLVP